MDFVSDALFNGKRFRALTVVDAYTRECLAIHVDQGIKGEQVVDVMDRPVRPRLSTGEDQGGQWAGIYLPRARSLGLHQPGDAGLQQARQADRQ